MGARGPNPYAQIRVLLNLSSANQLNSVRQRYASAWQVKTGNKWPTTASLFDRISKQDLEQCTQIVEDAVKSQKSPIQFQGHRPELIERGSGSVNVSFQMTSPGMASLYTQIRAAFVEKFGPDVFPNRIRDRFDGQLDNKDGDDRVLSSYYLIGKRYEVEEGSRVLRALEKEFPDGLGTIDVAGLSVPVMDPKSGLKFRVVSLPFGSAAGET